MHTRYTTHIPYSLCCDIVFSFKKKITGRLNFVDIINHDVSKTDKIFFPFHLFVKGYNVFWNESVWEIVGLC